MFDELYQREKELKMRYKYAKQLGWKEQDPDGDLVQALINVYDCDVGYNVYRKGKNGIELLGWFKLNDKAIEFAVDRARAEIAAHELEQQKREAAKENA